MKLQEKITGMGLTFDDVLLVPAYSAVLPHKVNLHTRFSRNIALNIPLVSAAMDTVSEAALCIALAREGGIGVIHKNMSPESQAAEVTRVKRSESATILKPHTLPPDARILDALNLMKDKGISGIPVVEGEKLVGIVTNRDLRFEDNYQQLISDVMTPRERLITAPLGTDLKTAQKILQKHRIEKLLLVDAEGRLAGLVTAQDILKRSLFPGACKDSEGRLRVAAAVGASAETTKRARVLVEAGVDALVVDSAHGHSENILQTVRSLRHDYPQTEIITGNVVTADGAKALMDAGVDGVKVGIGPGSICTTRVIAGVGVPQISAILEVAEALDGSGIPVIADGGIRYSGDIAKALAVGASTVMIGSLFAGTEESPGEMILLEGRSYKQFRGMGSIGAMRQGSGERYFQPINETRGKYVPEGIEGRVPYKGKLADTVFQLVGGLRAAMGYCGTPTIPEMQSKAKLVQTTAAGYRESHPHDVVITHEAPNYEKPR
ncbi:IMP dehydrogenase [candidate division KSB1 bacterium]|nr:MAG: IMP dehydrogenase [candidate division KSB1 bacterium]